MSFDPTATRSGAVFSDVPHYAGAWVCYINGVEVPVMGWQVDSQVWQVPSFTIYCLPDPAIQRLGTEDRIPVQIFYLDYWAEDKPKFRLLVDGEIVGWHFSSSTGSRTVAFSCLAHIHIFQQLYFFFMTNVDDIVASRDPTTMTQALSVPGLLYPYALFHQGLLTTGAQAQTAAVRYDTSGRAIGSTTTVQTTPDPNTPEGTAEILCAYELVTNVIKGVISTQVPTERRAVPMMNFFARHIRKTRFQNRWVRLPLLEDADKLNDRKGVFPIFNAARNDQALVAMQRQISAQTGSSGPVWNTLQQVLSLVYMEIAMITNPVCVRVKLSPLAPNQPEEGKILRPLSPLDPLTTYRRGQARTNDEATDPFLRQAIGAVQARQETSAATAAQRDAALRELAAQPIAGFPALPAAALRLMSNSIGQSEVINSFRSEDEIQAATERAQQQTDAEITTEYVNRVRDDMLARAANNVADIAVAETTEPIRLAQYFVKPNFFFGETPACNVIMPSMIDSWTFDESYINQPTRVYINDSVMARSLRAQGPNAEFMLHALTVGWPEEANAILHHKVGQLQEAQISPSEHGGESGRNLLIWPEEFFKGPVTSRAELPSWFQMLQQFANQGRSTGATPANTQAPYQAPAPTPLTASVAAAQQPFIVTTPGQGVLRAGTPSTPQGAAGAAVAAGGAATPPTGAPLPGSQAATTTPETRRAGGVGDASSMPAYAVPAQVLIGGAERGRTVTRLTVGGSNVVRDCLQRGSGLDPARFVPPEATAPWPMRENPDFPPSRPSGSPPRRGRPNRDGFPPRWLPVHNLDTRLAMLTVAIRDRLSREAPFNGLTQDQMTAAAFGFTWIVFTETGCKTFVSWAIANQRQYRTYPARAWTVNPWATPPRAFVAGTSFDDALTNMWAMFSSNSSYMAALQTMLTGRAPPALAQILIDGGVYASSYWDRLGGIRPDLFYMHLGYINYYAGGLSAGIARTRSLSTYFTRVKRLIDANQLPALTEFRAPIATAYQKPLFPPENAQLLSINITDATATGATAPTGEGVGALSSTEAVQQGEEFSELFKLYAQYEYLKQRYAQRSAGANLRFNPYLVVGFPAMLFDSQRTGMHSVGYVVGVSHSANAGTGGASMSTVVRMQFCRTIQEFIYDVRLDAARFNGRVTSAPAEIIDEIRAVIQDDSKAEEFYQKLLYGGQPPRRTLACFRWDAVLTFSKGIRGEDIVITGDTYSTIIDNQAAARAARQEQARTATSMPEAGPATQGDRNAQARHSDIAGLPNIPVRLTNAVTPQEVREILSGDGTQAQPQAAAAATDTAEATPAENNLEDLGPISPRPGTAYAEAFDNYHIAMQLASRPACSLEDYIRFWHGGRTINELLRAGLVSDPQTELAYGRLRLQDVTRQNADGTQTRGNVSRASATYYGRIFRLRLGPGQPPAEAERGYTTGPEILPTAENKGVAGEYPETRANWDTLLELYRDRVRNLLSPTT